jgi:double-stranded uracil-DNA glycosylase
VQLTSFPPIIAPGATVLILGSMPGSRSLQLHQYYGHPRNLFWTFMGELAGAHPTLPYAARVARVQLAGVALWDVLQHCERPGSLDAAIVAATEVPNFIPQLLTDYPTLRVVAFNGQKAAQSFARHITPNLDPTLAARLTLLQLPSTSPANASQSTQDKFAQWRDALAPLLHPPP